MSPGAEAYSWFVAEPRMMRFSKTRPGMRLCWLTVAGSRSRPTRKSTRPSTPNDGIASSGARVDLLEEVVGAEDQAPVGAVLALPVVHATAVEALNALVDPDLLAGGRIERHERTVRAQAVDDPAHDERIEVGLARRVRPRHLKLTHIVLGDLLRGHESGAVGTTGVVTPLALRLARDRQPRNTGQRQDHRCPGRADDLTCPYRSLLFDHPRYLRASVRSVDYQQEPQASSCQALERADDVHAKE